MVQVTVTGESRVELVKKLRAFADNLDGTPAKKNGAVIDMDGQGDDDSDDAEEFTKTSKKKGKKAQASFDEDEADDAGEVEETDETDDAEETDEDFTAPAKKSTKGKKVTVAQVNDACKARARAGGKKGRDQVLAILKKNFKTESISEIKPEQYAKVIAAMAV